MDDTKQPCVSCTALADIHYVWAVYYCLALQYPSDWINLFCRCTYSFSFFLLLTHLGQVRFAIPGIHEVIDRALESVKSLVGAQQTPSEADTPAPPTADEQAAEYPATISTATSELVVITGVTAEMLPGQ